MSNIGGAMYHIHKNSYRFLFLLSIAVILYATLYREAGQGDIELRLFWTIKRAWSEHSGYYWYLILGNIALFMPFGFFLTAILQKPDWKKAAMMGFVFSAAIEVSQVLLDRGLGEFDDVLHNTWGSLMGYCAAVILGYLFGHQKERYEGNVKGAGLFFGMTILMFTILILYNRPDWSVRLWRRQSLCLLRRLLYPFY